MANRDLTNFRSVTSQTPDVSEQIKGGSDPNNMLDFGVELASQIMEQSHQAKITEGLSSAQLDLSALKNQNQIDFEHDPVAGAESYKQDRKELFESYGDQISPLYKRQWNENVRNIESKDDFSQQNWVLKQSRVNTVASINKSMANNFTQASNDGRSFAGSGEGEIDGFLNFSSSLEQLQSFGDQNLGAATTEGMLQTYKEDYMKSFISGVMDVDPARASSLMEEQQVMDSFSDPVQYDAMKKAADNKVLNFQKIAVEAEVLGVIRNNSGILESNEPASYAQAMKMAEGLSGAGQKFLMKKMGYSTSSSGKKLSNAEKVQEQVAVFEAIRNFDLIENPSSKDIQKIQESIISAANNKSITKTDMLDYNNQYIGSLTNKYEEKLSEFDIDKSGAAPWFFKDAGMGFSRLDDLFDEVLIPEPDDGFLLDEEFINNTDKASIYQAYSKALSAEALKHNVPASGILNLDRDTQREIYSGAYARTKMDFFTNKHPALKGMEENMPANIIDSTGRKIKTGLGNGAASSSVSIKPTRKLMVDKVTKARAWVYPDGRIEEIK